MNTIPTVSPLEVLVVMELETIRLEHERLSQQLTVLPLHPDADRALLDFERSMTALQERSGRLERLLDGMSSWGLEDSEMPVAGRHHGELTAA
ncbi:MAG: hypothetical protein JO022_18280 [Acidobacteriaceae bacterium]|nr:hypothetical protein [Acidobacteriaceae bacterium]